MASSSAATTFYQSEDDVKLTVGDIPYLLVPSEQDYLAEITACVPTFEPVFVYKVSPGDHITKKSIQEHLDTCADYDDVYNPSFLSHIVFFGSSKEDVNVDDDTIRFLDSDTFGAWSFVTGTASASALAPGPYIVGRKMTWQPWRIYTDTHDTMVTSFRPKSTPSSDPVEYSSVEGGSPVSAVVPSRLYFQRTAEKPLNGMRIVVKDIFDMAGTKTTLCNRAWRDLYPASSENAPTVQSLLDKGAIIVGKTKLNAMIVREETMECVEYLAPFNPRGDGYQTSSGSSSGSCAALGAYDWVDFAIGSDTNGSCRKPAHWNGVFAIRPTYGVLSTQGVASFCPMFDVPAFFGRDLAAFSNFAEAWYGNSSLLTQEAKTPKTILYPKDYLPTANAAQAELIESFVRDLEAELGIKRTEVSLAEEWKKSRPVDVKEDDVAEYLKEAGTLPYYRDSYKQLASFRDGYKEKFNKTPFVHEALRWRWEVAENVTDEQRDELMERLHVYKAWALDRIFKVHDGGGVLVILPIENGQPNYRDARPPPFGLLSGFSPLYLSPIAGTPEVTAPVGEISYHSRISDREEPMPISVSIASSPGTDLHLIDTVMRAMKRGNKPLTLSTGRSIYATPQKL